MKTKREDLLSKLDQLDERLVNIWLTDEGEFSDEEIWDIFVVLLETRVELLKTCKEAGLVLSADICAPVWLNKLVYQRKEIRLREIRAISRELKVRKQLRAYESTENKESAVGERIDENI